MSVLLLLSQFLLPSQLLLSLLLFPWRPRHRFQLPWFRPPLLVLFLPLQLVLGFPHRLFLAPSTFSIVLHRPMVSAALGARLSMPLTAAFTFVPSLDSMWTPLQFLVLVV